MDQTEARRRWVMLALLFAARVGLGFQFQTLGSVADPLAEACSQLRRNRHADRAVPDARSGAGIASWLRGTLASDRVLVALASCAWRRRRAARWPTASSCWRWVACCPA